jgi:Eukaryotic-type carbonic anhydrase
MGTVGVFMNAYDDARDYDMLNRLICAWREDEEKTRAECGLPSVATDYAGCMRYSRTSSGRRRTVRERETAAGSNETSTSSTLGRKRAVSAHDLILKNHIHRDNPDHVPHKIRLDPEQHENIPDFDWDAFIAEQYTKDDPNHYHGRELLNYDHVGPWFNYFPMLGVRTEYYYRYSGTQTIPPCYGNWFENNNRKGINHWRMMKDPIRISRRQLTELHRLLRERIAPVDDPLASCQPDTAAKIVNEETGQVTTARPLQSNHRNHYTVFCECLNWPSKWTEDQEWCQEEDIYARFYDRPYNFVTDGF